MFIPNNYVPLTDAVAEAFANRHADEILAAGLQTHEAKQIADHWLARDRLKQVEFHAQEGTRFARRGKRMTGVVPRQLTPEDLAMARETPEIRALSEKGAELKPLLRTTWDNLRTILSAGEMMGYLIDADTGKHHKIETHEWSRDDADIAHVTGWFSIPNAWGRFVGPVALLRAELQQRVTADLEATKKGRAGRPRGSTDYDWEEGKLFAFKMLREKGDFANPANKPAFPG